MDAPNLNVINNYKWEFLRRRLLHTALGGPRLWLPFPAPLYVRIVQVLLWLAPAVVGVPLSLLVPALIAALVSGVFVAVLGMLLQTVGVAAARWDNREDVKTSILAQDDEVEFRGLCHWSTWRFIVPGKRRLANVLLHPVLGGITAAAATYALSTENLLNIINHGTWLMVVCPVLGWLTVCITLYSVSVAHAPEPASLQALDEWELAALYRPLYLLSTTVPLMAIKLSPVSPAPDWLLDCDVAARLCMSVLPLLWLGGVLPPWDVALAWLAEQTLVYVCGGSACASRRRLLLQLLLSAGQLSLLTLLLPRQHLLWTAAVSGYLLSTDLVGVLFWLWHYLTHLPLSRPSTRPGWWRHLLYHCCTLAAAGGLATAASFLHPPRGAMSALCGVLVVAMVTRLVYVELQKVYCLGLWRNKLYRPADCGGRRKWIRQGALWLHTLIIPLLLSLYVGWEVSAEPTPPHPLESLEHVISTICLARCYRWIWQSPDAALLETAAVCVLRLLSPAAAAWRPELVLTAASWLRDRLAQMAGKLYTALVLQGSWLTVKEKRRARILLAINLMLLPVTTITLILSCVFSAPFLPLCTLPLFIPTFPRRLGGRQLAKAQLAAPDAVYYHQMADDTTRRLGNAVWTGCTGFVQPGDYLLLRFDDRLMWVFVVELGNGYIYFSVKGLELQETSCHAAEATRVDDVFDTAFDEDVIAESQSWLAPDWYHALTPLTQIQVLGYSDARSQLTGVIDNSATLDAVEQLFPKVLTWSLLSHCLSRTAPADSAVENLEVGGGTPSRTDSTERYRTALSSPVPQVPLVPSDLGEWSDSGSAGSLLFEQKRLTAVPLSQAAPWLQQVLDDVPDPAVVPPEIVASTQVKVRSLASPPQGEEVSQRRGTLPPINSASASPPVASAAGSPARRSSKRLSSARVAPMPGDALRSLPSQQRSPSLTQPASRRLSRPAWEPLLPPVPPKRTQSAVATRLALPPAWSRSAPPPRPAISSDFPADFWLAALGRLLPADGSSAEEQLGGPLGVAYLKEEHERMMRLLDAAYHGTMREIEVCSSPSRVHALFRDGPTGDSPEAVWLRACSDLATFANRAYRWSVKLALDTLLLGGFDDDAELLETLEEYRDSWHIGLDSDPGWRDAVLCHRPFLFALGYDDDKSVYTSHLLTLGRQRVSVGRLSSEMVRAIWASTALELLYVTNDDEERYSIQAHPTVLRNLTVQAADPPLGYPVYSAAPLLSTHL